VGGAVVALLSVCVLLPAANLLVLSTALGSAAMMNRAGLAQTQARQLRYLAHRFAYETAGDERARLLTDVRDVSIDIDRLLLEVRDGAPALGIPPAPDGPVLARITEAEQAWRTEVRPVLERLTRTSSTDEAWPALQLLERGIESIVARVDEAVRFRQTIGEGRVRNLRILQTVFIVIIAVMAGVALRLVVRMARRVGRLTATAERVAAGELSLQAEGSGTDEIAGLGRAFNTVTATLGTTLARASAQEAEMRTILNSTAGGIIVIDEQGTVRLFNASAEHIFGYQAEDVVGRNVSMLMPSPYREQHDGHLARHARTGEAHIIGTEREVEGLRRDGTTFPMSLRVRQLRQDGPLRTTGRAFVGSVQDITERKQIEEQFRQVQKFDAVGRLAGGIAHDFNNVLTVIIGLTSDLIETPTGAIPHHVRKDLEEIRLAGERAASLTQQLLAFSRKQIVRPMVLNLNTVVARIEMMLRRLIGEDIELRSMLADDLGRVRADAGQIEQVLVNLAVNARDAMPAGGKLTIETGNVALDREYARGHVSVAPGRYAMIAVSDTGVGIPPEVQARLFEPFFTTKELGRGTGLGLATVYGIVKQSGGNIWVYSEPDKGATFKIYLPLVDEPVAAAEPPRRAAEAQKGSETVLIVEDEEAVRALAGRTLLRDGYTVLEARSSEEALRLAAGHAGPIHLLLTDVVMPGMSGQLLARRLAGPHPDMKVIYMSGYTDNAIVHHGVLEAGLTLLQKPFTPKAVARLVREVLDTSLT
jgi:PAS domain S-box-containing protein